MIGTEDPGAPAAGAAPGPASPSSASTFRVVLLGILVVALLASAGTLVWLLAGRRGAADQQQAEREAVMAQTEQFVLRLNTYGPDLLKGEQMPEYQQRVSAVITPKFDVSFQKVGLRLAEQTVARAGYARQATLGGVGVESMDDDSATTIVGATFTGSYPNPKHRSKRIQVPPVALRWEVRLVKYDGKWLVDNYTPITGDGDQ